MRKFIYIALCCVLLQSSALSYEKYKRFPSGTPGRMKFPTSACSDGEILSFTSGAMVCASSAGGGDALVANPLSQFAATTSLQLIGVISDETGTGLSVFGTAPTFETSITGNYLTASEILITDASKNIVSAPEATYPSLAELAFVKGLTSGVQAQLNAKVTESTTVSAPLVKTTYALSIPKATTSVDGYLSQTDWDTFNNKISSQWTTATDDIYFSTGNVGIGTIAPSQKLDIAGNININTNGTDMLISSYHGANSDGNNSFIGGGGQNSIGEVGNTYKGSYNTAQGAYALRYNTTGYYNSAQGAYALYSNTTGNSNSAQGLYALLSNTTGNSNSAQGYAALRYNTTGSNNSAQGYAALRYNTTGYYNSAQGAYALYSNTTGNSNSAQGLYALFYNTTGNSNSAQGLYALYSNTTGYNNSAQGYNALRSNTTGYNNSAQGYNAGRTIIDGNSNTFIGYIAGYHASQKTNAVNSMALGNGAYTTADNQVVIGNTSVTQTLLNGNVGIGTTAPSGKLDIEGGDVFIGSGTLTNGSGSEDLSVTGNVEVDGIIVADGSITAGGSVILDGTIDIGTVETFVDEDATPDVSTGGYYNTNTTTTSITDFDGTNIADGQIIVVISKGAITYDVTSSGIVGGTTDIVTATGDVTNFLYDGTDWYVIARIDQSDDLN